MSAAVAADADHVSKQSVTDVVVTTLALGAVVVQAVLAVAVVAAAVAACTARGRRLLGRVRRGPAGDAVWLAWGVALVATLGSLYFSEVAGFIPCRLCWFQRVAMYPMSALLLVAALRRDARGAFAYGIALPVIGAAVSAYHIYIEINPAAESGACKVSVPCSLKWIEELGYVTIPVLALTAFAAIATLLVLARARARESLAV